MEKLKITEGELKSLIKKVVVRELKESTDRDRYEDVVFLQGDEADEALEILDNQGEDAAMNYLTQWHDPGHHMGSSDLSHGSSDYTYEKDGYIMSWNTSLGYIGLQYELSKMDESKKIVKEAFRLHKKSEDLKQINTQQAEEAFNKGYVLYMYLPLNGNVSLSTATNLYLLTKNYFDGSTPARIEPKNVEPSEVGFKNIIAAYSKRAAEAGADFRIYTLFDVNPYEINNDPDNKITEDSDFYGIRNQVAYPQGGSIGGPHKQPIKDKDFNGTASIPRADKTGHARKMDVEWLDKQVERLLGLNNYSGIKRNKNMVSLEYSIDPLISIIKNFKQQRSSNAPDNTQWVVNQFKYSLNELPKEFSIHFGIDRDSDKSILSFLEHGTDSLIGNYEEYKKLISRPRPEGTLTNESKQKLYNLVENVVRKVMLEKQDNFKLLLGVITSNKGNDWKIKADANESFYVVRPLDGLLLQMPPEVNEIGANRYGYEQVRGTIEKLINQKESGLTESTDLKHYTLKVKHDNGKVNLKTTASSEKEAKEKIMKAEGCPESAIISCKETGSVIKEGVAQNNPKIEKYVNKINGLISQAFDSDGDPIGVIDPTSTWEEPYVYEPIIYKNGILKIVSYSWYKPTEKSVDVIKSGDMEYEGVPTLQLISRMYNKALKNRYRQIGVNLNEEEGFASDGGYYNKPERNILVSKEEANFINKIINEFKNYIVNKNKIWIDLDETDSKSHIFSKIINYLKDNGFKFISEEEEAYGDGGPVIVGYYYWLSPNQNVQDVMGELELVDQLFYDNIK